MKKIFISHSSLDKAYVGELIHLIESVGVSHEQIFCSSFDGYNFDLGENFLERLKKELNDEILALFILTQNFYKSPISLCEMGAVWVKSSKHIPILIPPFDFIDMKGVFPASQGIKINEKNNLNSLKETLEKYFSLSPKGATIWEHKREKFLTDINKIIQPQIQDSSKEVIAEEILPTVIPISDKGISQSEIEIKNLPEVDSVLSKELQGYMIEISSGEFLMGDEKKGQTKVTISKSFLIAKYPIKQSLYEHIIKSNPSHFIGIDLPVERVSWFDAIEFCNQLSNLCGLEQVYEISGGKDKNVKINYEKNGYRLPTEAEWEYACRGNKTGDTYDNLTDIAWYDKNSEKHTQKVGQKKANDFGLYDMLGNVWEWCNDWYEKDLLKDSQIDPIGSQKGIERILRGGSWSTPSTNIRTYYRERKNPYSKDDNKGFRIVLNSISK